MQIQEKQKVATAYTVCLCIINRWGQYARRLSQWPGSNLGNKTRLAASSSRLFPEMSVSPKLVEISTPPVSWRKTDMCYSRAAVLSLQQAIPNSCPAKDFKRQAGTASARAPGVWQGPGIHYQPGGRARRSAASSSTNNATRAEESRLRTRLPLSRLTTRFCFNCLLPL